MHLSPDDNTGDVVSLLCALRETINGGKQPGNQFSGCQAHGYLAAFLPGGNRQTPVSWC